MKAEVGGQVVTLTFHVTDTTAPDPVKIDYTSRRKEDDHSRRRLCIRDKSERLRDRRR